MQAEAATTPFLADQFYDAEQAKGGDHFVNGTSSFFRATFNGLNTLLGIGILSVPYALSRGGWLSLILLTAIASATCYSGLLIKKCMDSDSSLRSYFDIGDKAFGPKGRLIVSIVINLELYLIATSFLILVADNLNNLFPNVELNILGFVIGGKQTFLLLSALIIMPTVWIDNLTTLSYVSATGIAASIIVLGSVIWSGAFVGVGFHHKGELFNWSGLPTSLSLYTLCYCGHPVFPTIYTSMRNPKQFKWVLVLCFVVTTFACASMAILGYLMFGLEVEAQITLNMPMNKLSSKVATYTALVNPLSKYALILKPILDAIEGRFRPVLHRKRVCSLCTRTMLLVSTVVVALTLPYYEILMSLVGAFTTVMGSILLPCLCYLKIYGVNMNLGFGMFIIGLTMLMGLLILVVGTYTSLIQIFQNIYVSRFVCFSY